MNLYQEGRQSCKIVRSVLRGSMYVFDRRRAVRGYDLVGEKVQIDWQKIGNHEFHGFLTFDIRSFSITFQRLYILETWRGRPCSLAPGIRQNGNLSDVSSAGAAWDRSSWCMLSLGWIRRRNRSRWPIGRPRSFAELPGKCTRASGNVVPAKCQFSFAYDVKAEFFRGQFSVLTDLWICLANLQTNSAHIDLKYIKIHQIHVENMNANLNLKMKCQANVAMQVPNSDQPWSWKLLG